MQITALPDANANNGPSINYGSYGKERPFQGVLARILEYNMASRCTQDGRVPKSSEMAHFVGKCNKNGYADGRGDCKSSMNMWASNTKIKTRSE
jgi:hypothetical protein